MEAVRCGALPHQPQNIAVRIAKTQCVRTRVVGGSQVSLAFGRQRRSTKIPRLLNRSRAVTVTNSATYFDGVLKGGDNYHDSFARRIQPLNDQNCGMYLTRGSWALKAKEARSVTLEGVMEFQNTTESNEIFVTDVETETVVLSKGSVSAITVHTFVEPMHSDPEEEYRARPDGYWPGYVVVAGAATKMRVYVELRGQALKEKDELEAVWLKIKYMTYGPHGRVQKTQHVILPLKEPKPLTKPLKWKKASPKFVKSAETLMRLALPTHLLSTIDDPVEVVKKYAVPYSQPGDIVTIGETPMTAMQGRWRHPENIRPGWLSKLACKLFKPTSSLATCCGMQSLIDMVGSMRVVFALVMGIICKVFLRKPGMFYHFGGYEAKLIDDLTGCIPPYDKFIMPGPAEPAKVAARVKAETGLECAIVDVNDKSHYLGMVILACTDPALEDIIRKALIDNPTGNAIEQTPLVLIRP
mmetsp:Transcript_35264/g.59436  ORF Transcript_35264/g.59436 Transcript_35264/m.59436 type:complete len:469 (+) Transcript_35264:194-1600(+)|eukprot:CAMPEP_0198230510 /NCGR_PEP_ID=MMETSP1445-20131203/114702_1 /TAXON_ID=36898 /ORGANISM="Pyramimonas sp., Strain CCMP2087" /LENGTH=468 /DNA_ID=CAMNT_0043911055 /DNA_START=151 /DNA_END=1557 /DNA_ORIENTATION=-